MKILIIRFSAMGDIILTTPVLRAIRLHFPNAEIHFLVKKQFQDAIKLNSNIDRLILFEKSNFNVQTLKNENYTFIFDLQGSIRSKYISFQLGVKTFSFPKNNIDKWLMVNLKYRKSLDHIVLRYAESLKILNINLDEKGLNFPVTQISQNDANEQVQSYFTKKPIGIVLGGTYFTKKWITSRFSELCNLLNEEVIFFGGNTEIADFESFESDLKIKYLSAVGKYPLEYSAALLMNCKYVITHDTGLMHIAAALQIPTLVLWGNTLPELGMEPYLSPHINLEIKDLSCRPCSKIGFQKCPKGHFKCMNLITSQMILEKVEEFKLNR